jgi:adenylosuccinate synthase
MAGKAVEPVYRHFDGWLADTTRCTAPDQLPARMTEYISYVNESLGIPIAYLSNGPGRDQLIPLAAG